MLKTLACIMIDVHFGLCAFNNGIATMIQDEVLSRIEWTINNCRLLKALTCEFRVTQPFAGLSIGTAIHVEPKTAALLLTLKAGGARLLATGNLNSTQPATVAFLKSQGIEVIGGQTVDEAEHSKYIDAILARKPDLLLDNGGDIFARVADRPYVTLRGGTEETTTGRERLVPLRDKIKVPVLVINDSPIKQFAENKHAVGQSMFESYVRFTNRSTNGKRVTVFGYGACGQGVALNFRNAFSLVSVVDRSPVKTLEAHLDGFNTPNREIAIRDADVIITVTGAKEVITADDLSLFKNGVVLLNGGHLPHEIDVKAMAASPLLAKQLSYPSDGIVTLILMDGREVHLLGGGHMANLSGPRPLGNSIESMDIGFALQSRCLEIVARGGVGPAQCVVPVPTEVDDAVATAYVELHRR